MMKNDLKLSIALIYFVSTIYQCNSCINGSNPYLGAVFEPYTKPGGRADNLYPESEIFSMIQILSTRFHRISSYGNEGKDSAGSRVPVAAAKANLNAKNTSSQSVITVNAAIWQRGDITGALNEVMSSITSANNIFPGTVTGLIVRSDHPDNLVTALRIANNHTLKGALKIGTRLSTCEQLASEITTNNLAIEMFKELNFVFCHQLPTAAETPEDSAKRLIITFDSIITTFNQAMPSLEVITQTGWPTNGGAGTQGIASVANMERFWCEMNTWSQQKAVKLDFFTAFDEPWKSNFGTTEPHYGWWLRVRNESSNPEDFEEKIVHNYDTGKPGASTAALTLYIVGSLGFITLIILVGFLYYKLKSVENLLLSQKDIEEFEKGCVGHGKDDAAEDALRLPYDRRYEISKSKFRIDSAQLLGKGAFGAVYKGYLESNENPVAFKMTLSTCTSTSLKSLLSEIKIMIHVGKHPNVVCIIGAFTGEMRQGRILIATELCERGSLLDYLQAIKVSLFDHAYANLDKQENANIGTQESYANIPAQESYANVTAQESDANLETQISNTNTKAQDMYVNLDEEEGNANLPAQESNSNLKPQVTNSNLQAQDRYVNLGTNGGEMNLLQSSGADNLSCVLKKLPQWSYQIASGMEYIASKNIIHADLAARNVLLTSDETAKITDFGLSRRLYEYTNYVKQNQEPMPWRWMAIAALEQLNFSTKSDIWSYGVMLFEIFSFGDIPYPGLSWNQNFTRELHDGLRLTQPQFANESIYGLMKSCWALNPRDRPAFTNLKESLHNLLKDPS